MDQWVELNGQGERDKTEPSGGARSLSVCLSLLAALNLVVMMIVTQLPITAPGLEHVVQQGLRGPIYLIQGDGAGYAFQSCTGGDSVNCHSSGNIAGL